MSAEEEQRSTLITILIILGILTLTPGCGKQELYKDGVLTEAGDNAASFLCFPHGGVDKTNVFVRGDGAHVKCKDGLTFDIDTGKAQL